MLQAYDYFLISGILFCLYLNIKGFLYLCGRKQNNSNFGNNVVKPLAVFGILLLLTGIIYGPTITGSATKSSQEDLDFVTQKISDGNLRILSLKEDIVALKENIESPHPSENRDALIRLVHDLERKIDSLSDDNEDLEDQLRELEQENNKIYSLLIHSGGVS